MIYLKLRYAKSRRDQQFCNVNIKEVGIFGTLTILPSLISAKLKMDLYQAGIEELPLRYPYPRPGARSEHDALPNLSDHIRQGLDLALVRHHPS